MNAAMGNMKPGQAGYNYAQQYLSSTNQEINDQGGFKFSDATAGTVEYLDDAFGFGTAYIEERGGADGQVSMLEFINGDGSPTEFDQLGAKQRQFEAMDLNADRQLTADEVANSLLVMDDPIVLERGNGFISNVESNQYFEDINAMNDALGYYDLSGSIGYHDDMAEYVNLQDAYDDFGVRTAAAETPADPMADFAQALLDLFAPPQPEPEQPAIGGLFGNNGQAGLIVMSLLLLTFMGAGQDA